jgi:hypothetical protein
MARHSTASASCQYGSHRSEVIQSNGQAVTKLRLSSYLDCPVHTKDAVEKMCALERVLPRCARHNRDLHGLMRTDLNLAVRRIECPRSELLAPKNAGALKLCPPLLSFTSRNTTGSLALSRIWSGSNEKFDRCTVTVNALSLGDVVC